MAHDPIAYTYEADYHCPDCAEKRFGRGEDGWIAQDAEDNEGNPVGVVAPWDEWQQGDQAVEILRCGTCERVIEEYVTDDGYELALWYAQEDTGDFVKPSPGKFEGCWDERVASLLCYDIDPDESFGGVDEGGWWGRIGQFIVSEDTQGFFNYRLFDDDEVAGRYFDGVQEGYYKDFPPEQEESLF